MSATTLTAPIPVTVAGADRRPGIGRLVAVELRKVVDTRAGFWLQVATVVLTVVVVLARVLTGGEPDHSFAAVLDLGVLPAAVLLPVAGVLLVTSEWSQRTGMITFALVPMRSRVVGAKIIASVVLTVGMLAMAVGVVAAGVLVAGDGAFADVAPIVGQTAVYLTAGTLTGVAFGMVLLASAPALVALFSLPIAWTAVATLSFFADVAPWLDTRLAYAPMTKEVMSSAQWGRAGTALALWMLLPLLVGAWRIARREVAA
jgi:ABC-2 type transport system permease protein